MISVMQEFLGLGDAASKDRNGVADKASFL
jgi:hypothetical protein